MPSGRGADAVGGCQRIGLVRDWTLRDENGDATTDYSAMRTASVTVRFKAALNGIDQWTSDTTTCSGVPDPEPSVTPTPSPTP